MTRSANLKRTRTGRSGFTLVEMMVVILIIAILAAVILVNVVDVFGESDEATVKSNITTLKASITQFSNSQWGFTPSSNLLDLGMFAAPASGLADPNDTNTGIETLVYALRLKENGGPFIRNDFLSNNQANVDADQAPAAQGLTIAGSQDLFEIIDAWGNPLVYITLNELEGGRVPGATIQLGNGTLVAVDYTLLKERLVDPATGNYFTSDPFFIYSFGPNGANDWGEGDDITSWK